MLITNNNNSYKAISFYFRIGEKKEKMVPDYTQLVERISRSTSLTQEDIERRIEAKRAKLSGLISKEGAAQVVAAELGVSFDKEKMKISEFLSGMKKVNVVGKIVQLFPIREYNKNGRSGKIGTFVLADSTSNVRTVLWDSNHIDLLEKNQIKENDVIEITNAMIRNNELHLSGFSDMKKSAEDLGEVKSEKIFHEKKLLEVKQGDNVTIRSVIVQIFEPRFFSVCPSCSKKVSELGECQEHGKVVPEKRYLLNLVLDDGTGTIRGVFWKNQINHLLEADEEKMTTFKEDMALFEDVKNDLLGEQFKLMGRVKKNDMFERLEFNVQVVEKANPKDEISRIEKVE